MRTTVTFDPDVAIQLRKLMEERKLSFKEAVNSVMRAGLSHKRDERARKFVQKTFSMGQPVVNLDKALELAAAIEDEERIRKMALGK